MLLLGVYGGDDDDDDVDDGGGSFGGHSLLAHQCPRYHSHDLIFNTFHNSVLQKRKIISLY